LITNVQGHNQETSDSQAHKQVTSNAKSQLKENFKSLQIKYLFLHLIYNQRCKQLQTKQTL